MFKTFGNKVRIKSTSETEKSGFANRIGEIYGQTTPSMMDFEVIGNLNEDIAFNVFFEETKESIWFAEQLLEEIDNGEGATITLDGVDKKWTKNSNNEWIEENIKNPSLKKWWQIWK